MDSRYDYLPLFSILIISVILLYGILSQAILPLWNGNSIHKIQLIFALFMIGFITAPLLTLRAAGNIDPSENRNINPRPHLHVEGKWINSFGKDFEDWFNDIFGGRRRFIKIHNTVEHWLNPGIIENSRAFAGADHWLFYKGDDSISLFQNKIQFSDVEVKKIEQNYLQQKDWLAGRHASYYIFIAPNKADIYGEYYKQGVRKVNEEDRIQSLKEKEINVPIIYPLQSLLQEKEAGFTYFKNDTHWSSLGAYQGYLVLMQKIQQEHPDIESLTPEKMVIREVKHEQGDLSGMLDLNAKHWYQEMYLQPEPKAGFHYQIVVKEKNELGRDNIRTICQGKPLKVIIFRDSFSTALLPYLSETFGDVTYIWDNNLDKYADLIKKEQPDLVIHEMVSRYAGALLNETPNWRDE